MVYFKRGTTVLGVVGLLIIAWIPSTFAQSTCGALDVVFVIDTTASMGAVIGDIQSDIVTTVDEIETASSGDYHLGLVTFKDEVTVENDLAGGNKAAFIASIQTLSVSGGGGWPEASDEALNTVINGLDAADRNPGDQIGDFNGTFRPGATKIIVLITDARPGGFDDLYVDGVDDVNAHQRALEAQAKGILISAIDLSTGDAVTEAIMQDYAATTGGIYATGVSAGVSPLITDIINSCGAATETPTPTLPATMTATSTATVTPTATQTASSTPVTPVVSPPAPITVTPTPVAPPPPPSTIPEPMTVLLLGSGIAAFGAYVHRRRQTDNHEGR